MGRVKEGRVGKEGREGWKGTEWDAETEELRGEGLRKWEGKRERRKREGEGDGPSYFLIKFTPMQLVKVFNQFHVY